MQGNRLKVYRSVYEHCVMVVAVTHKVATGSKVQWLNTSAASVDMRGFDSRKVTILLTTSTLCSDEAFVVDICTYGQ